MSLWEPFVGEELSSDPLFPIHSPCSYSWPKSNFVLSSHDGHQGHKNILCYCGIIFVARCIVSLCRCGNPLLRWSVGEELSSDPLFPIQYLCKYTWPNPHIYYTAKAKLCPNIYTWPGQVLSSVSHDGHKGRKNKLAHALCRCGNPLLGRSLAPTPCFPLPPRPNH